MFRMKPGDFEFIRVIGKGSFGKVLLARHRTEEKTYAIKVLNKSEILRKNEVRHIMCERRVLEKNIRHPFLVSLHLSFQTAAKLYLVMDYISGGEVSFFFFLDIYYFAAHNINLIQHSAMNSK